MARRVREPRSLPSVGVVGVAVLTIGFGLIGGIAVLMGPLAASDPGASARPTTVALAHRASAPPRPSATGSPSVRPVPSASPTPAQQEQTPRPGVRPGPQQTAGTSVGVRRPTAPTTPREFDLTGEVIDIAFPIRPEVRYRYRDNWLDRRDGAADPYNHAREGRDGSLLRLHDGVDVYGPEGAPVVAPFAGRVIDPASRWTPWEPDRYGLTVVIESTEPGTRGYAAMLVHLDYVWVEIGQRVQRGQVLGVLGRTGNAEDVRPQLHFELRAPFQIDWSEIGYDRRVDAFNPYPSLVEADPNR